MAEHPDYVFVPSQNDLVLIKVALPSSVQPATLNSADMPVGTVVKQIYGPLPPDTEDIPTINLAECQAKWIGVTSTFFIGDNNVCLDRNGDPLLSVLVSTEHFTYC